MVWVTVGIIVGGRLGQVLLWEPGHYLADPLEILMIWKGGMAFHGGLIGVIVAILLYARSQKLSPFAFSDVIAASTPIGLFLGRIANFVNGELLGRPTDVPWAIIFPQIRHAAAPSRASSTRRRWKASCCSSSCTGPRASSGSASGSAC